MRCPRHHRCDAPPQLLLANADDETKLTVLLPPEAAAARPGAVAAAGPGARPLYLRAGGTTVLVDTAGGELLALGGNGGAALASVAVMSGPTAVALQPGGRYTWQNVAAGAPRAGSAGRPAYVSSGIILPFDAFGDIGTICMDGKHQSVLGDWSRKLQTHRSGPR